MMVHKKIELLQALSMCSRDIGSAVCDECPYSTPKLDCFVELNRDVLEYIMELRAGVKSGADLEPKGEGQCRE